MSDDYLISTNDRFFLPEPKLTLTKEECDTLWRELMHYHIPYDNPQMRDIVYRIRKFLERNE